jgi:hypothetical protein
MYHYKDHTNSENCWNNFCRAMPMSKTNLSIMTGSGFIEFMAAHEPAPEADIIARSF